MLKTFFRYLTSFLVLFSMTFSSALANSAVTDLENKIESHQTEIEKLNQELEIFQRELNSLSQEKNTLSNEVKKLDITKKKLETDIRLTEEKITKTDLSIKELGIDITNKDELIKNKKTAIAKALRQLYDDSGQNSLIFYIASGKTLADTWRHADSILRFQEELEQDIVELSDTKQLLEADKKEAESLKEELISLKSELGDQKKIVVSNETEKNNLLSETKNQESKYAALVKEKEALIAAFEAELQAYESELQYILDPSKLPAPGSGPLGWPLSSVLITQQFGVTADSGRLYATGSHSGVDFRASTGTPVFAMANGTVVDYGDTDIACRGASFGKWVLIRYSNGLAATFGHLSLVKVSKGQMVTPNTLIAYSGNTGRSTAPHLHVTVYAGDAVKVEGKESLACTGKILVQPRAATNAYLDPLLYMPKTTSSMFK